MLQLWATSLQIPNMVLVRLKGLVNRPFTSNYCPLIPKFSLTNDLKVYATEWVLRFRRTFSQITFTDSEHNTMLNGIRVFKSTVIFCESRPLIQKIHSIVEAVCGSYDITGCVILVFICESTTEHKHEPNISFRGYK